MASDSNTDFTVELRGTWNTTPYAELDLLPGMRTCPDLTAAQVALPDAWYRLTRVTVLNKSAAATTLNVARTVADGNAGRFQDLSVANQAVQTEMPYPQQSRATSIALDSAGPANYLIQVKFRLETAP